MGVWGPKLYQDDIAVDLKDDFNELYKKESDINKITELLLVKYKNIINDEEDGPIFWLILADIQWKYGILQPKIKENALKYIKNGSNLKIWFEENPKEAKHREKVLKDLKIKLESPMPAIKKIKDSKLYKCQWNINDVFAYKLESNYAIENGLYGRYILIRKIDEGDCWPGHIIPIVYFSITNTTDLPTSLDEINNSKFIITFRARGGNEFRMLLLNTSKRIIPKKIQYIGNFEDLHPPKDEFIVGEKVMLGRVVWKGFEKRIIDLYLKYNIN